MPKAQRKSISGKRRSKSQEEKKDDTGLSDAQLQRVASQVAEKLQQMVPLLKPTTSTADPFSSASGSTTAEATTDSHTSPTGNVAIDLGTDSPGIMAAESVSHSLDYGVSESLKQKIIGGDYIDLGQLLQRRPGPDKSKCLTIEDGQLVVQQKPSSVKITDINQWTDAFLIFSSIFSAAHPESTSGLFKYLHTVRLGAKRTAGLGWKFYDEQYRLRKATNPASSWGVVDQELWLLYMYYGNHPNNSSFTSSSRNLKCYTFNFSGSCTKPQCFYLHKCLNCSGTHPSIRCVLKPLQGQHSDFRSAGANSQYPTFRTPGIRPAGFSSSASLATSRPTRGTFRFNNLRAVSN